MLTLIYLQMLNVLYYSLNLISLVSIVLSQVDDDTPGLLLLFSVELGTSIFMFQEQIGLEYP